MDAGRATIQLIRGEVLTKRPGEDAPNHSQERRDDADAPYSQAGAGETDDVNERRLQ